MRWERPDDTVETASQAQRGLAVPSRIASVTDSCPGARIALATVAPSSSLDARFEIGLQRHMLSSGDSSDEGGSCSMAATTSPEDSDPDSNSAPQERRRGGGSAPTSLELQDKTPPEHTFSNVALARRAASRARELNGALGQELRDLDREMAELTLSLLAIREAVPAENCG